VGRQPLEQVYVGRGDLQVPQLDLAVRPGEIENTPHRLAIAVVVGQGQRFFACLGHAGAEQHRNHAAGFQAKTPADAENRIEHRTGRVR